MLCERPRILNDLGIDAELANVLVDKFPTLRLTEKTLNAVRRIIDLSDHALARPVDCAVLTVILDAITDESARSEATRLIDEFGSLLGVTAAIENNDRKLGLSAGVAMRIDLLSTLYLSKLRRIKIATRAQAELYAGELIKSDGQTTAFVLDGGFAVIDAINIGDGEVIADGAAKSLCLPDAAYVICSRKTPTLDDRFYDIASRVRALSAELKTNGITLADFLIFTPQGNAHLINANTEPRFEFVPYDMPYRF